MELGQDVNMRVITFIMVCCICFGLWQVQSDIQLMPIYTLSLYKIGTAVVIYFLAKGIRFERSVKIFCITYSIVMLYPFCPSSMKMPLIGCLTIIDLIEYLYFSAWFLYAIGLSINIYFNRHEN